MWRHLGPFLLDGAQVFFVCQAKTAQQGQTDPRRTVTPCKVAISAASAAAVRFCFSPTRRATQSFKPASLPCPPPLPLRLRRQTTGRGLQLDHVVDELHRDLEPFRRGTVRIPLRHMIHHPLTQLYRTRLSHQKTPISTSNTGNHISRTKGILKPVGKDML